MERGHFKDVGLNYLAQNGLSVAQFISHDTDSNQRFLWVAGYGPNHEFESEHEAVCALLKNGGGSLNIRSYDPRNPKSQPFLINIGKAGDALTLARNLR